MQLKFMLVDMVESLFIKEPLEACNETFTCVI